MKLFLDTNVIIGFIFSLDPLNKVSNKLNLNKNVLYYSFHVKKEVNKIFNVKNYSYLQFLTKIEKEIDKYPDSNIISRETILEQIRKYDDIKSLNKKGMREAFETIWIDLGFTENQEVYVVKIKLREFINEFESKTFMNKNNICDKLKYIAKHQQKYNELNEIIDKLDIKRYLHDEDKNILFDVHEFCEENPQIKMYFVSWDKNFINAISKLKNEIKIYDFISIKDVLQTDDYNSKF